MKKEWVIGVIVVVIVLVGVVLFVQRYRVNESGVERVLSRETEELVDDENQLPNLVLSDLDGNDVNLRDFVGKPLIVNAWATWCPFCVNELPDFVSVKQEVGDDIVIIAIDRAEPGAKAEEFLREVGIAKDDLVFLLDPNDSFYENIGGFSMPETLFVTSEGEINFHKRGVMGKEEILERARGLL